MAQETASIYMTVENSKSIINGLDDASLVTEGMTQEQINAMVQAHIDYLVSEDDDSLDSVIALGQTYIASNS